VQQRVLYEVHDLSSLEAELDGATREAARLSSIEELVFKRAGRVVAITSELRRLISERHHRPLESIAVVPDGTTINPSVHCHRPSTSAVYYVGQLYPWKGVDTLLHAAAADSEAQYVLVGGTEEVGANEPDIERLKGLAHRLNVADRVQFTGWVPYREVSQLLRDAAVTVIPLPDTPFGRYFTSPLKLFDYMAAGVPIVASDLPSLRDVLKHETNALLVPPGNHLALADAVKRLRTDPPLARRLADQARDDVRQYSWDARAARLLSVIRGDHRNQA
jgi:glycosyltransferase involved in cell wall biosynthesis